MSMVFWIKRNVLFVVLMILFNLVHADEYASGVKSVEITVKENAYILAADLNYHLSPQSNDALQNGVPLFWTIKIKLKKERNFWFDKTELKYELRYRLQYHALLKMYRVRNENTEIVNNFSTLTAALNYMATIRDLKLLEKKDLLPNTHYLIAVKILFDDSELPLPLQTQVIANSQWQLSSEWTYWNLEN
jgi:hypothetical protein